MTSPFSEAVEQASDAAVMWMRDLAAFAQREADALAAGEYDLGALVTAPVRLLKISVRNAIRTAGTLSDNLALLSYGRPGDAAAVRTFPVGIEVPPTTRNLVLRASGLRGQMFDYHIPRSRVRVDPAEATAKVVPQDLVVRITVDCAAVPNDIYVGDLSTDDGSVVQQIRVAIDEFGAPIP
jgi:hypothetical protein